MQAIREEPSFELQVIATGSHLAREFGHTADLLTQDGFAISAEVPGHPLTDTEEAVSISMGEVIQGCAQAYARLAPDCIAVLGDRTEILAAVVAALPMRIPVAHLHGGEITEGAIDEQARHALTKLSHLHFAATEAFAQRIIQMGEDPARVWAVGAIGLDVHRGVPLVPREKLLKQLPFELKGPLLLATLHPATLDPIETDTATDAMLEAFDRRSGTHVLFTQSNSDSGGRKIFARIEAWAKRNSRRAHLVRTLGTENYWSWMQEADAMIGNSSSGLIEAPSVGLPAVNIGSRQAGRLRGRSVIDATPDPDSIVRAIDAALRPGLRESLRKEPNPYGDGRTAPRIIEHLKKVDFRGILVKKFKDRG